MKQFIACGALAIIMSSSVAQAGSLSDPVVTQQVVAQDARDNSNEEMQLMLAVLTLGLMITLAISAN